VATAFAKKVTGKMIDPTDLKAIEEASKDPVIVQAALDMYTKEAKHRKLNGQVGCACRSKC
jgi:hypothetical protein